MLTITIQLYAFNKSMKLMLLYAYCRSEMDCSGNECSIETNFGDCVDINKTFTETIPVSLKALDVRNFE